MRWARLAICHKIVIKARLGGAGWFVPTAVAHKERGGEG